MYKCGCNTLNEPKKKSSNNRTLTVLAAIPQVNENAVFFEFLRNRKPLTDDQKMCQG